MEKHMVDIKRIHDMSRAIGKFFTDHKIRGRGIYTVETSIQQPKYILNILVYDSVYTQGLEGLALRGRERVLK